MRKNDKAAFTGSPLPNPPELETQANDTDAPANYWGQFPPSDWDDISPERGYSRQELRILMRKANTISAELADFAYQVGKAASCSRHAPKNFDWDEVRWETLLGVRDIIRGAQKVGVLTENEAVWAIAHLVEMAVEDEYYNGDTSDAHLRQIEQIAKDYGFWSEEAGADFKAMDRHPEAKKRAQAVDAESCGYLAQRQQRRLNDLLENAMAKAIATGHVFECETSFDDRLT